MENVSFWERLLNDIMYNSFAHVCVFVAGANISNSTKYHYMECAIVKYKEAMKSTGSS